MVFATEKSRMVIWAMGPHHTDRAASHALWIKTMAEKDMVIVNSGSVFAKNGAKRFFNLNLKARTPELQVAIGESLFAENETINDGEWHYLAAVIPKKGAKLNDVQLYVDGHQIHTKLNWPNKNLHFIW